jgi:flagellar hook protein FlgE
MYTTIDGRNPADPTLTTPLVNKLPFKSDGT